VGCPKAPVDGHRAREEAGVAQQTNTGGWNGCNNSVRYFCQNTADGDATITKNMACYVLVACACIRLFGGEGHPPLHRYQPDRTL
jgi:hypothetical protein